MAKPKTIKAPKDIDPAKASKPELVKKLREFARYTVHLESSIRDLKKREQELEQQIREQQDFMVKQQSEISYQDRLKAEEFKAVEERAGRIEDTVTQIHAILSSHDNTTVSA